MCYIPCRKGCWSTEHLWFQGEDLREGNSPSWFNPAEAVQIIRYIQGLKKSETCPVKPTDIGVISPYKKQVGNEETFLTPLFNAFNELNRN